LVSTARFIMNNGKFLGSRLTEGQLTDFYIIGEFFGNLHYRSDNGRIESLEILEDPSAVQRYLSFQN